MAENAPLSTAHAHARRAAEQTTQIKWAEAADEHSSAASNYARAARNTSDSEALRILRLLEEQHSKLASIIRTQDASESVDQLESDLKQTEASVAVKNFAGAEKISTPVSAPKSTTSALAAARFGSSTRESSPSLARDIASRRGIPQPSRHPPSAAAQARARQLSPESHRRNRLSAAPKIPPSVMDSQTFSDPRNVAKKNEEDAAFASFYNNLTTGTMSKLSSVLAYAGLPLTADDIQPEQPKQKLDKRTVSASNDPDVKKLFSKAALDAIEDEHRQRGTQGHVFGPAESFYVVQTSGGMHSYADVTKAQQQLAGIDEDDEDSFVDASEAPMPASPRHSRHASSSRNAFGKSRTHEELELENTTLKTTLESLANRLADFEAHAQDASMAALAQSMTSLSHQGPTGQPDPAVMERLRQLEQQLEQQTQETQKLQNLASKQEKSLKSYKSKWDDIKKSARERERAKREKLEKDGGTTESDPPA